ncbi:carboxy terminal-processing peptidase [Marinobacterium arenosum]|uniref:carboxy terminal-processing peptidase n=1 Tax=Marinobacterium arenosum TaxID=2862496 RepID=UPI001C978F67|nr:carboxy terminal-processing peptidase [Marinobacterium arenosum]MBY4678667.1 carboxy terminal-processing peptidase [Marinobacterium arenosum]
MPNYFFPRLGAVVLSSLLLAGSPVASAALQLSPEPIHKITAMEIVEGLQVGHYAQKALDDNLSSSLLQAYLDDLDPSRSHFMLSDIDRFEHYGSTLDDDLKRGDLSKAYEIYNRYLGLAEERLQYSIRLLEENLDSFRFDVDESLDTDRSDAPWIASQQEMDELWRKRVKSALLNLKLADKPLEDARDTLLKRYRGQLERLQQINSEDVFQRYANSLTELYDPHTQYFSPQRSENFQINMSLSLEGIGAVLQRENEYTKVVRLVPAGPADKSGQLQPADLIVGVGQGEDGEIEDVVGWRLDEVVQLIRGPKDSTVRLEVIPADAEDSHQRKIIKIKRSKVKLEEQAAHKRVIDIDFHGNTFKIGVIEVPAFYIDFAALQRGDEDYKSTSRDVEKLIAELKQEKVNGIVIDLRNNGGGSLREANEMVGLFINRGPTVQIQDTNGRIDVLGDRDAKIAYEGPLAVLVNRLSASASEIFAGAIQDYQRGIVLGGQTFGKGTVQALHPLDHGQLKLTHAKFYRISGASTQHKGVEPDISFPTLYDSEDIGESALDGALAWDTVRPVRHGRFIGINPIMDELIKRHEQRAANDPDFIFMREQVQRLAELRDEDLMSLNEQTLKAERDEAENWQLGSENRRRIAKQQPPVSKLSELEKERKEDAQGRPINPESEAILAESGRILVDLIDLTLKYAAARQ